jgi:hypothetical protein
LKVLLVVWPKARTTFFDQFEEYDVTVWDLHTDFQTTLVPFATETDFGEKKLHFALTRTDAVAGNA